MARWTAPREPPAAFNARTADLFLDDPRRYQAGEPLLNVVDPDRGY